MLNVDIVKFISLKNISQIELANKLGYTESYISKILNGKHPLNLKFIATFKKAYPFYDNDFAKKEEDYNSLEHENSINPKSKNKDNSNLVPLMDVVATGSVQFVEVHKDQYSSPIGYIDVGGLMPRAEFVIRVSGNSMTPNYPSGCLIGIRKIQDGYFDYGSVYVIETKDNRFIKRVFKSDKDNHVSLNSDNEMIAQDGPRKGKYYYEPFNMPLKDIKRIFKVVGSAKSNDHSFIP